MTRDEILTMEPGRELDALVAEKVMEWRERIEFDYVDGLIAHYVPGKMDVVKFSPSTDISAAWEVVEQMSKEECPMSLENNHYKGHFNCGFYTDDVTIVQAESPTAPEAICKAALLAVMDA